MRSWDEYARIKCAKEDGWESGMEKGIAIGMEKVFSLLEKDMSLEEAKKKLNPQARLES